MRTVKKLEQTVRRLSDAISILEGRVTILECDHKYVAHTRTGMRHRGNGICHGYRVYELKCNKCRKVLRTITEDEHKQYKLAEAIEEYTKHRP